MFGGNSKKASSTAAVVGVSTAPGSEDEAAATGTATNANRQRTQHRSLITIVHAKTLALARTVQKYPRKHRDLSSNGVLADAVEALEDFKDVEWPPRRAEMEVVLERVPSWLGGGGSRSSNSSNSGDVVDIHEEQEVSDAEKQDRAISELERDLDQRLSLSDNDKSAAVDEDGKEDVASCSVDAALEKELEDANVNDEEEAEELHQEVLNAIGRGKGNDQRSESQLGKEDEVSVRENGVSSFSVEDEDQENKDDLKKVAAIKRFEQIVDKDKPMETPISPVTGNTSLRFNNNSTSPRVDAAAMEPMHPAVITTLHALCMVISSESKTLKMAETALECISILTNGRYVSGVAGGRVKLEVQRKISDPVIAQQPGQQSAPGHDGRDGGLSFLGYVVESITRASDLSSEAVQGAMAKALLAIMTCPKCGVHEAAMLQAVRSTFHVYLVGKSPSGKELARRTLVDMLKCVFMRMEAYDIVNKGSGSSHGLVEDVKKEVTLRGIQISQSTAATNISSEETDAASTSVGIFASQYHTDSYLLFRALCKLSSKTLPGDENVVSITNPISGVGSSMGGSFFSSTPIVDPLALNSKILSLELILAVFEHCGEAFRNGEKFIYAVQSYLCVSLLKNCMSNQTVVAHLSLKIFLLLVRKFKTHLKAEIEVFVANIFLRVLESPNSPFEQKVLVLEALRALCADPQMLTQLFLNYDCDFDAVNLYKDIVHHVTRISAKACASKSTAGSVNTTKKIVDQELDLSRAGLEVLVVILRSFLKSLGLPGGDDVFDESGGSSSMSLLRQSLKIDIGDGVTISTNDTESQKSSNKRSDLSLDNIDSSESRLDGSNSGDVAGKIVDAFDKKRTKEQNFEIGRVKFKLSFKDGLKFFIENGVVELDAQDMARFLYENSEELDKTQIGEVLGKEIDAAFVKGEDVDADKGGSGFYLRVLYHYVDKMEFTGLMFDDAIRIFLSGFRLPGEAQKIDRIMEKFAERFTSQNESVFPSPDTAFILGFSVIMLNTDLHNPSIKPERRMTMDSFIRNNKGIADGGDLPEEFLAGIFNRIKEKPFSLKEDDEAREKVSKESTRDLFDSLFLFEGPAIFGSSAEEKRREKFRKEREEMMSASEQLFKKRPDKNYSRKLSHEASSQLTDSVSPADVVKPMFDVTWGPLIGTLSQVLEASSNETSIALCLSGFVYSIRISSHSDMSLARNTFVNSLAKFTTLGSIKEMKSKNIECIRTLLSIAIIDGEYLGESWSPILQCISQLGRLHLFASGLDSQDQFLQSNAHQTTKISEAARGMEESNGKAVLAAINEVLIDKVFSSSVTLSARGVVSFIEQLIDVSEAEISGDTKKGISGVSSSSTTTGGQGGSVHGIDGPRVFSLQRLVEVADYNMAIRPRLTWSQIWEKMGNHFAKVGCNKNAMVSMFAIDALRQLSLKFLEKPELTDFNFQRLFLKPFLLIMKNPGSREDVRELVLRCVDNIIRMLAHNLRSGWKIFFSILMLSSSDPSVKINTLGLAILQRLLDDHLDDLCPSGMEGPVTDEGLDQPEATLSSSERSMRNANADDFVWLCRASLSFVQIEESETPLPIGLSMRALCHTACYADLIAGKKVLPPVSGCQHGDPMAPGFTYDGLTNEESLEMAIWRPLFDGLASGMCSPASSVSGGVGCLVQRGSAMALRAILLRHGKLFSVSQWSAILSDVILPAVQIGAQSDSSPVTKILSESPLVSSLDFVGEPLLLPPDCDDEGLEKFAAMTQSDESSPSRPLGVAELLVEASFADLRHGGDGNLSNAYSLKTKDADKKFVHLQPFPYSWIATTAPIALGMLSDIIYSMLLDLGKEAREVLWPIVTRQLGLWSVGALPQKIDEHKDDKMLVAVEEWQPCEALVRISCKEWSRVFCRVLDAAPKLSKSEAQAWLRVLSASLSATMVSNIELEEKVREDIVKAKLAALSHKLNSDTDCNRSAPNVNYLGMLPMLKTRCIASHCLQQYLSMYLERFAVLAAEDEISCLLDVLNQSRFASSVARKDEDLAHAFQEAFINQFGESGGVEEIEAALQGTSGRSGHRGSSQIFFLTQEASATKALIILLSLLYCGRASGKDAWDAEAYSEPLLMESVMDVLNEFLTSEEKDGLSIDPNVWRSASESGGQVAVYCTSFAGVVVIILEMILKLKVEKFSRQKQSLFPVLCSLVRVQSGEIRHLVSNIFRQQIGPMILTDSK
ncbi:hypothetical protein ACHAW5_000384 [Stephanodiscus triporus]|uniref:SEC7 domain-containing protein n=1 Tax=Stephanodiscus triporus TaxID=2934178 RepID=A0ABD3N4R1_9STRA